MPGFPELLLRATQDEGFPLAGIVDLELAQTELSSAVRRYDAWLDAGCAGAMSYLVRGRDRRAEPRLLLPSVQSVLCVAEPYSALPAGALSPRDGIRYARYVRGENYHARIARRLEKAIARVGSDPALAADRENRLEWRVCVDTGAVLERAWAATAGLGWIGKNTLLIHPRHGSYLLLGVALLSWKSGRGPSPVPDYCGNCSRCLRACPTSAFIEPRVLDANRCISYWTLEKRGELALPESDRAKLAPWAAGCDLCQEACPFNTKPARTAARTESASSEDLSHLHGWEEVLRESLGEYQARAANSALDYLKPVQWSRNLAVALAGVASSLPMDQRARLARNLVPLIRLRLENEADQGARRSWGECLALLCEEE